MTKVLSLVVHIVEKTLDFVRALPESGKKY